MDKIKRGQAGKLQTRLDKLLLSKEKKQKAFEKSKKELKEVSQNVEGVKLKLFEILQSGSDDTAFSSWAKRRISENENEGNAKTGNPENAKSAINENGDSSNPKKPKVQMQKAQTAQTHKPQVEQNQNQHQQENRNPQ